MKSVIRVKIREDGSFVVTTGDLKGEHHCSADDLLKTVESLGLHLDEVKSTKGSLHGHSHEHGHSHGESDTHHHH